MGNTRNIYNSSTTVLYQSDYYPFGLDILRSKAVPNKYLYNGKEKQNELTQYDYGARFYDPVISRWHVVDPIAHEREWVSHYNFVQNNPINRVDPTGALDMPPSTDVEKNKDGTYTVVNAKNDGDNNIYVVDSKGKRTGETKYSALSAGNTSDGKPIITTLRAMGNMTFGANMHSTAPGILTDAYYYRKVMEKVGAYNQSQNGENGYNSGAPYYGEHTYSSSYIYYGYFGKFYSK